MCAQDGPSMTKATRIQSPRARRLGRDHVLRDLRCGQGSLSGVAARAALRPRSLVLVVDLACPSARSKPGNREVGRIEGPAGRDVRTRGPRYCSFGGMTPEAR
jgi:hypothetical protein